MVSSDDIIAHDTRNILLEKKTFVASLKLLFF